MTLGPITMSGAPGTGSFWLQQMLQTPEGLGLVRGGPYTTNDKVPVAVGWRWDRHAPGPCTCTCVRNVDELLRCWFGRFRKKPPPASTSLRPDSFYVYLGEINTKINYWGPDFKTWLDSYLSHATGEVTKLLARFTRYAIHTLHQENLVEDTIKMLQYENVEFDEAKVRAYPRINETKDKPPWPGGYQDKLIAAG